MALGVSSRKAWSIDATAPEMLAFFDALPSGQPVMLRLRDPTRTSPCLEMTLKSEEESTQIRLCWAGRGKSRPPQVQSCRGQQDSRGCKPGQEVEKDKLCGQAVVPQHGADDPQGVLPGLSNQGSLERCWPGLRDRVAALAGAASYDNGVKPRHLSGTETRRISPGGISLCPAAEGSPSEFLGGSLVRNKSAE